MSAAGVVLVASVVGLEGSGSAITSGATGAGSGASFGTSGSAVRKQVSN